MFEYHSTLKAAFNSVIRSRGIRLPKEEAKKVKNNPALSSSEHNYIHAYILDNTGYASSEHEISLAFKSFQRKRTHKKKKNKHEQLSLITG